MSIFGKAHHLHWKPDDVSISWQQARDTCVKKGLDLAAVPFQALADELQQQLTRLVGGLNFGWYYIGAACKDGAWSWLDGTTWAYTRWPGASATSGCDAGQCLGTWPGQLNPDQVGYWGSVPCNEPTGSPPMFVCSSPGTPRLGDVYSRSALPCQARSTPALGDPCLYRLRAAIH